MKFLLSFLMNLVFLAILGIVLYLVAPEIMQQVFELYGAMFGPGILIILLVIAALPRKRRSRGD